VAVIQPRPRPTKARESTLSTLYIAIKKHNVSFDYRRHRPGERTETLAFQIFENTNESTSTVSTTDAPLPFDCGDVGASMFTRI
jgi:hypothetical protein